MKRTPPPEVRRKLRQEVGFGCPLPDCGSPYLEWHHFDPPWHVRQHHEPAGMIALCSTHHKKADINTWTKEQLRKFKQAGKGNSSHVRGRFDWMRNRLLGVVGGNFCYDTPILFYCSRQPIIWFTRDAEGYLRVNLRKPRTPFSADSLMKDNDWLISRDVVDIECPPSGRLLAVKYPNGDSIRVEFRELDSAQSAAEAFPAIKAYPDEFELLVYPLTAVEFQMKINALDIDIGPNEMHWPNAGLLKGCFVQNCEVGFRIG